MVVRCRRAVWRRQRCARVQAVVSACSAAGAGAIQKQWQRQAWYMAGPVACCARCYRGGAGRHWLGPRLAAMWPKTRPPPLPEARPARDCTVSSTFCSLVACCALAYHKRPLALAPLGFPGAFHAPRPRHRGAEGVRRAAGTERTSVSGAGEAAAPPSATAPCTPLRWCGG